MNYINVSRATVADLQPRTRLYVYNGDCLYVARIGNCDDWAAYKGSVDESLDVVADCGIKVAEVEAVRLFGVCKEARLNYRV
ncbi:hypothetical protein FD723_18595 [Nostoc sp. C052]|uniref:hypothetical protein n=1 Tax=Nostoc sp. C052 TaxID=2576902 RepID=UPI0015C3AEFF|nr:hypothetical protein [Nostoc sp. C052]QLE42230.1 hypothetical protein FD723_18595 [Nostoc sp. C052]